MADIFDDPQTNSTVISDTATDADSPDSALTRTKERELIELLITNLHGNFDEGTLTSNPPNDTTGFAYDTAGGFTTDEHNGRRIIFTDGNAKGQDFLIDDTVAGSRVVCTGDNLYSAGARSGDGYIITGNFRDSTVGHDHNDVNSRVANYRDGFMQIPELAHHNTDGSYTEDATSPTPTYATFDSTSFYLPQNATTLRCRIGFACDTATNLNVKLVLTKINETDGSNGSATSSNVATATGTTIEVDNLDIDCSALAEGLYHLQQQVQTPSTSSAKYRTYFYNTYWIN